ncbi:MAG: response regulator [Mongoliibacter sp.]|jgi:CheY-like chemotaxis protein|uniref:response regulator n=1 Tax=Mongoliibacter sp. TaxID=2022438 RepID=UPI0012F25CFF|nr:response regulator [Mongoliibacter sp.]TVP51546.1 MAG: response regulator [Mongoliibacter sp.]
MKKEKIKILLVEDNEGDIVLTQEAFEMANIQSDIAVVRDGEQAIDYLTKSLPFKDAFDPDLILLDINIPRKNGHEVLKFIKNSDYFKHVPVIMLTTSSSEKDINESYENHASCYIIKPVEVDAFLNVIVEIENFWSNVVELPRNKFVI